METMKAIDDSLSESCCGTWEVGGQRSWLRSSVERGRWRTENSLPSFVMTKGENLEGGSRLWGHQSIFNSDF